MTAIINLKSLKKIKINMMLNKIKPCQFVGEAFILGYKIVLFGRYYKEYLLKIINCMIYYLEISLELFTFEEILINNF